MAHSCSYLYEVQFSLLNSKLLAEKLVWYEHDQLVSLFDFRTICLVH